MPDLHPEQHLHVHPEGFLHPQRHLRRQRRIAFESGRAAAGPNRANKPSLTRRSSGLDRDQKGSAPWDRSALRSGGAFGQMARRGRERGFRPRRDGEPALQVRGQAMHQARADGCGAVRAPRPTPSESHRAARDGSTLRPASRRNIRHPRGSAAWLPRVRTREEGRTADPTPKAGSVSVEFRLRADSARSRRVCRTAASRAKAAIASAK
jgi:hypothetical protein